MTIKTLASTTAILVAGASIASAGGLDRVTFSSNILYEKGTYAEAAFAITTPKVSGTSLAPSFPTNTVAKSFNTVKLGFKTDLTDKIAVALTYTNQPVGADINYAPLPLAGSINGHAITLLGKYQFTERVSAFGGVKYQYLNGSVAAGAATLGQTLFAAGEAEYGYILGAAYEIPDIKLRVALSFESKIEYSFASTISGSPAGTTTGATPDAWTLEFQTGVAPKTLVFGSIRYAKWSGAQVALPGPSPITTFEDTTKFELGVAHRFSEGFVGFTSLGYEAADNVPQGAFAPTDGQFDVSVGGRIKLNDSVNMTVGMTYSPRGSTTLNTGVPGAVFENNEVLIPEVFKRDSPMNLGIPKLAFI